MKFNDTLGPRFWRKVDAPPRSATACWNWTACKHASGYGWFKVATPGEVNVKRPQYAHRVIMGVYANDPAVVSHKCGNPSCVRPDHLTVEVAA